jgi:hypothetical protein
MAYTNEDYKRVAEQLKCEPAAVAAVAAVESAGSGFDPEGFPKTLFEGHWFYKLTNGKYAQSHPDLCYPKWTKQFYGKTWREEKDRLNRAIALDRNAALMSASWGSFQIMGYNFAKCGYKTVQQFVNDMCKSDGAQLDAFAEFVHESGMADELQDKRWADFARLYNGPGYAQNSYDKKLAAAYAKALQTLG